MAETARGRAILRRKPIEDVDEPDPGSGLQRTLGLRQLTAIGLGGGVRRSNLARGRGPTGADGPGQ